MTFRYSGRSPGPTFRTASEVARREFNREHYYKSPFFIFRECTVKWIACSLEWGMADLTGIVEVSSRLRERGGDGRRSLEISKASANGSRKTAPHYRSPFGISVLGSPPRGLSSWISSSRNLLPHTVFVFKGSIGPQSTKSMANRYNTILTSYIVTQTERINNSHPSFPPPIFHHQVWFRLDLPRRISQVNSAEESP